MPAVTCRYTDPIHGALTAEGKNAADRGSVDVGTPIQLASIALHSYMLGLNKITPTRSAFACAEAHALSGMLKLLAAKGQGVTWADLRFSIATASGGYELWQPCLNCCEWLSSGGWMSYKLSDKALQEINGPGNPAAAPNFNSLAEFPKLGK